MAQIVYDPKVIVKQFRQVRVWLVNSFHQLNKRVDSLDNVAALE